MTAIAETLHSTATPGLQIAGAVGFLVLWELGVRADARDDARREALGMPHLAE